MYSKITIGGDCDVNYVWSTTKELTVDDITTLTDNGISTPIWDESTNLLATFVTDVNGDCVDVKDVIKYVVQKQEYGSETKTIVCETVQSIIEVTNSYK